MYSWTQKKSKKLLTGLESKLNLSSTLEQPRRFKFNFTLQIKFGKMPSAGITVSASFTILIMIFGLFGNITVFYLFYRHRRLRSTTNYFILSLAVSNILVTIIAMPIWVTILFINWPSIGTVFYRIWLFFDILCGVSSIMNHVFISVDRYVCIKKPMNYRFIFTGRKTSGLIFIAWFLAFIAAIASLMTYLFQKREDSAWFSYFIVMYAFLVPVAVMTFCYANIFLETWRLYKRMQKEQLRLLVPVDLKVIAELI